MSSKAVHLVGVDGIPGQGNYMLLCLKVEAETERIVEARFQTYPCPSAIACGNWTCEWAEEKTLEEARALEAGQVARGVGGLPLGREHCPQLAVSALHKALAQWEPAPHDQSEGEKP